MTVLAVATVLGNLAPGRHVRASGSAFGTSQGGTPPVGCASVTWPSVAIEGFVAEQARAERIVRGADQRLRVRSEKELAGYRGALDYLFQDDPGNLSVRSCFGLEPKTGRRGEAMTRGEVGRTCGSRNAHRPQSGL